MTELNFPSDHTEELEKIRTDLTGLRDRLARYISRCEDHEDEDTLDALTDVLDALEDASDGLEDILG